MRVDMNKQNMSSNMHGIMKDKQWNPRGRKMKKITNSMQHMYAIQTNEMEMKGLNPKKKKKNGIGAGDKMIAERDIFKP